eukprot:gene5434-6934_t
MDASGFDGSGTKYLNRYPGSGSNGGSAICYDAQRGVCTRGDNCKFSHTLEDGGGSYDGYSAPVLAAVAFATISNEENAIEENPADTPTLIEPFVNYDSTTPSIL